jgi:hypothetical protein
MSNRTPPTPEQRAAVLRHNYEVITGREHPGLEEIVLHTIREAKGEMQETCARVCDDLLADRQKFHETVQAGDLRVAAEKIRGLPVQREQPSPASPFTCDEPRSAPAHDSPVPAVLAAAGQEKPDC